MAKILKALVVDDDPGVRRLLRRLLAKPSLGVIEAGSAAQARAAARSVRLDLLICDVNLPDGDGLGLVELLRGAQPGLKALVMTGEPTPERRRRAAGAGAGFLAKPASAAELAAAVAALLDPEDAA